LRADARAVRLELADFVEFMLGTGMRIGEAAGVRDQVLDLTARTVRVDATSCARPQSACGSSRTPRHSRRTLALPGNVIAVLRDRADVGHERGRYGVVFPSPMRMLRGPSNTQADLRSVLDRPGYGWMTSHTFRKTVATPAWTRPA
jgi:integrase